MAKKIAVVGLSVLYPEATDSQSFWSNIVEGRDCFSDIPKGHWLVEDYYDKKRAFSKIYARRGAFLPKVDFDPLEFGIPPNVLSQIDTVQLLSLLVAKKVLQDAHSVQFGKVDRKKISVILGVASATELVGEMSGAIQQPNWIKALRENGLPESKVQKICQDIKATYVPWTENTFPGLLGNVVAGRIANRFDLGGTNCVVDAACASSLSAMAMAIQELQLGHSELVISGGADALNDIFMFMCFSQTTALSFSGDCRPFAKDADGTMLGEGIGMVALRCLEDALRDGDKIYAVICGVGSSSDGKSKSIYAPRSEGQALAIERAYQRAGYSPDDVDLVEAHGTGTRAGDLAEFKGLSLAFDRPNRQRQSCALGSIKSQIGHTKGAAGAASLCKIAMALHHKVLPPTIKVAEPNPQLDLANSPFYLNTKARPWIHSQTSPRRASLSSFGFGGSNFHITVEEYRGENQPLRFMHTSKHLVLVSGRDIAALKNRYEECLEQGSIDRVAHYSQEHFSPTDNHRLALVARDMKNLRELFAEAQQKITESDAFAMPYKMHYCRKKITGKIAYIFSGQGSQYIDMGRQLLLNFPQCREIWDLATDIVKNLPDVVFPIPSFTEEEAKQQQQKLTLTQWAQPAIGAISAAQLQLLATLGIEADCLAGHSYGELTALHAARAIGSLEDFLKLSRRRGELMAEAAKEPGAMTAVFASVAETQPHLAFKKSLVVANINHPRQTVVAGKIEDVEALEQKLQQHDLSFRRLPVATAFHSKIVESGTSPFREFLENLSVATPEKIVYSNTSGKPYPASPEQVKEILSRHLTLPVEFLQQLENMHDAGVRIFLEVGPGNVLTNLVQECLKRKDYHAISMDNRKKESMESLWDALGQLAVLGVDMRFEHLWRDFALREQDTEQKSAATIKIDGTNFGRPYPPKEGAIARPTPNPETVQRDSATNTTLAPKVPPAKHAQNFPLELKRTDMTPENPKSFKVLQGSEWLAAFREVQNNALEVQKFYQKTLSDSLVAFLQFSENTLKQLGNTNGDHIPGNFSGRNPNDHAPLHFSATKPDYRDMDSQLQNLENSPVNIAPTNPQPLQQYTLPPKLDSNIPPAPEDSKVVEVDDLQQVFLRIIAEKTGYGEDMLNIDMNMESDLGIDSIKRVEIFSEFQKKYPQMGDINLNDLETRDTLREIIDFMKSAKKKTAE